MVSPYDVFLVKSNGTHLWIGCADTMQGSWRLIERQKFQAEDKFMIYDRDTGKTTEVVAGQGPTR